jgi:hypothetical protein
MSWEDEIKKVGTEWTYDPKSLPDHQKPKVHYSGSCFACHKLVQRGMACPEGKGPPSSNSRYAQDGCAMQIPVEKMESKALELIDEIKKESVKSNPILPISIGPEQTLTMIDNGLLTSRTTSRHMKRLLNMSAWDEKLLNPLVLNPKVDVEDGDLDKVKELAQEVLDALPSQETPQTVRTDDITELLQETVNGNHQNFLDYFDMGKIGRRTFFRRKKDFIAARKEFDSNTTGTTFSDYLNQNPEFRNQVKETLYQTSDTAFDEEKAKINKDDLDPHLTSYLEFIMTAPMSANLRLAAFPKKKNGKAFKLATDRLRVVPALLHIMGKEKLELDETDFSYRKEGKMVQGISMKAQERALLQTLTENWSKAKTDDVLQQAFNDMVSVSGKTRRGLDDFLREMRNPTVDKNKIASQAYKDRSKEKGIISMTIPTQDWDAVKEFLTEGMPLRGTDKAGYKAAREEMNSHLPIGSYTRARQISRDANKDLDGRTGTNILLDMKGDAVKMKLSNPDDINHPFISKLIYSTGRTRDIMRERYSEDTPEKVNWKKSKSLMTDGKFNSQTLLMEDVVELVALMESGYSNKYDIGMKKDRLMNSKDFEKDLEQLMQAIETNFPTVIGDFKEALKDTIVEQYTRNEQIRGFVDGVT